MSRRGACALAITARDEGRLLPAHLAYHRLLGVEHAFVYLDEDGDATLNHIRDLDWVSAGPCVPPERFRGRPGLERFVERWTSHLEARQSLNVVDAMMRAEEAGCEWLLSIDADELVCLDRRRVRPGSLLRALADMPRDVAAVWLPNLEVVQSPRAPRLVFHEARLFKGPGGPPRPVFDPRDDRLVLEAWFLGHCAGKSLVRLGRGAVPYSSHRFCTPERKLLPAATLGETLHYHAYDFADWYRRCRSHQRHSAQHVSGLPAEAQKLLWVDVVETLGGGALEEYYEKTFVLSAAELERLAAWSWRRPLRSPPVVEVSAVAEAFEHEPGLQRYRAGG